MAERRQRGVEAHIAARQRPVARHRAVLDPTPAAFLIRSGHEGRVRVPVGARRRPHRLGLGPDHRDRAVAFEFSPAAAVDQPPIVPRLGDQRGEIAHAARAAGTPMLARAIGPATMRAATARTSASVTASSLASVSAIGTGRPWMMVRPPRICLRPALVSLACSSPALACVRARLTSGLLAPAAGARPSCSIKATAALAWPDEVAA